MQTAQHNNHFLLPSKNQGFALMTELASLVIFGFGMLALSPKKRSVQALNHCKELMQAGWLTASFLE